MATTEQVRAAAEAMARCYGNDFDSLVGREQWMTWAEAGLEAAKQIEPTPLSWDPADRDVAHRAFFTEYSRVNGSLGDCLDVALDAVKHRLQPQPATSAGEQAEWNAAAHHLLMAADHAEGLGAAEVTVHASLIRQALQPQPASSAGEWSSADYDAAERALRTLGMSSVMHRSQLREFAVAALDAVKHRLQPQPAASAGSWEDEYKLAEAWVIADDCTPHQDVEQTAIFLASYVTHRLGLQPPPLSRETVADLCSYDDEPSEPTEMATPEESACRVAAACEFMAQVGPRTSEPERAKAFELTAEEASTVRMARINIKCRDGGAVYVPGLLAIIERLTTLGPTERERELERELQRVNALIVEDLQRIERLESELAAANRNRDDWYRNACESGERVLKLETELRKQCEPLSDDDQLRKELAQAQRRIRELETDIANLRGTWGT